MILETTNKHHDGHTWAALGYLAACFAQACAIMLTRIDRLVKQAFRHTTARVPDACRATRLALQQSFPECVSSQPYCTES